MQHAVSRGSRRARAWCRERCVNPILSRLSPFCRLDVNAFIAYDAREELKALGIGQRDDRGALLWDSSEE